MAETNNNTLIVGPVRLSYLNVFKPRTNNLNGKTEYSAVLLFPKEPNQFSPKPKEAYKALKDKMQEVAAAKFGPNLRGVKVALKDGDATSEEYPEPKHPGYWYINVSAKEEYQPGLITGDRTPALASAWKSGDWGLVKVSVYAYDAGVNKGVSAGLRGIQFLFTDEPLGATSDPTDGFDVVPGAHRPQPAAVTEAEQEDPFADD